MSMVFLISRSHCFRPGFTFFFRTRADPVCVRHFASQRKFLPYDESRAFVQQLGCKKADDFFDWSRSGQRPDFIPGCPHKFFGGRDWISYPHYLGYERTKKTKAAWRPKPKSEKCMVTQEIPKAQRKAFIDFVTHHRPDFQLRTLPSSFNATHLFRCIGDTRDNRSPSDSWIPLQVKISKQNAGKNGFHCIRHTADPQTGVIFLRGEDRTLLAGKREELKTCFRASDCHPWEAIFDYLDEWWRTTEAKSEFECIRGLRSHVARSRFWNETLVDLDRVLFRPLNLSVSAPDISTAAGASFILGGRHRVKMRVAGKYIDARDCIQTAIHSEFPYPPGVTDFDFFLAFVPPEFQPAADGDEEENTQSFFLFPHEYLLQAGYLPDASATSLGRHNLYLYPPFKTEKRTMTRIRKAEQAPYWVDSIGKFEELLRRFGGVGDGG